jgi:tRNA (cytidine/uridine-2'-O-)-methyltransferase
LSSQADHPYHHCRFRSDDWLLFGRESDGLPPELLELAELRLTIPMAGSVRHGGGVRSLNLSVSVAVVLFEALRQLETGV